MSRAKYWACDEVDVDVQASENSCGCWQTAPDSDLTQSSADDPGKILYALVIDVVKVDVSGPVLSLMEGMVVASVVAPIVGAEKKN